MTKPAKRLEKFRNHPTGVRPEEIESLLLSLGFEKRPGKGDHRIYFRPGEVPISVDFGRNPCLEVYVKGILKRFGKKKAAP